jgi:hypothetical protein
MLKKYARQEITTDSYTLRAYPKTKKKDTVFYNDRECTEFYCLIPWYHNNIPISRKRVTLNCFNWEIEWVKN